MIPSTILTVGATTLLLAHIFWLGAQGDNSAPQLSKEERKQHTIWGMFYLNPNDPRGWVPKTWGYGWTVNMRSNRHVAIFVSLITLTLLGSLWMTVCAV